MTNFKLSLATHPAPPPIEGLDGIRALAVTAVIVFHADLRHFLPGGFLGVDVFFVLSGFLITSLLFRELENTGTIGFGSFYIRRSKRLLAALLTVLFACAAYTAGFAHDAIPGLRQDIPPALLYYSNLWQLFDAQPYFERFGRPHALQHLWSLAIEEQFYILWPPLLLVFYRLRKSLPPTVMIGFLGLCSMAWMAWLAELNNIPYENKPERLYFGTDTHAIGLLFGAFLASFYRKQFKAPVGAAWHWNVLGGAALLYLLACFIFLDESLGFLYRGGFASISLATACLILGASRHGSVTNTLLRNPVAEWIGKRSYSLYLWHWPVFVYFRPGEELPEDIALSFLIRLALTLSLSDATYRLIELPIRAHGLRAFGRYSTITFISGCIALMAAFGTLHLYEDLQSPAAEMQAAVETEVSTLQTPAKTSDVEAAPPNDQTTSLPINPNEFISTGGESRAYNLDMTDIRITALGDSVMLGARPVLTRKLPITYLNAEVGRQGSDLLKLVKRLGEAKELSDSVLIHIGTNGYIYEQNLKQILQILQSRKHVVFINVHAERRWTDDNNALLRKYQKFSENITLVDWHAASESHPEYFVKDGIHLTAKGMVAYAEFARAALGVPDMPNRTAMAVIRPTLEKKATAIPATRATTTNGTGDTSTHTEEVDSPPPAEAEAPRGSSA